MKKHFAILLALLTAFGPNLAGAAAIQQQGIKTAAQCIAAGASLANCLPLTAQVYDSFNGQQLSTSIANGQIGGGGGSKNYLTNYVASTSGGSANPGNGDAELNTTSGWSLAHTALSSLFPSSTASAGTPFDSTHGGSAASGNLALTTTSTNPLQKKYSFQLASSAASVAGDMLISNAFYIDSVDQTQPMTITLSSQVTVGASGLNFSGSSSNSFAIYVYDVTVGAWIQPSGVYGMVSSGVYNVKNVVFQPQSSTSTRYQLAVINVNASSGAYTMLLDAFGAGPQAALSAPALSDWSANVFGTGYAISPSGAFGTTTGQTYNYRRVGDSLHYKFQFSAGTTTGSTANIVLPSGLSIDYSKHSSSASGFQVGIYYGPNTGGATAALSSTASGFIFSDGSDTTHLFFTSSNSTDTYNKNSGLGTAFNNSRVNGEFVVPIQGWSSNTVASSDTDTRVNATFVSGSATTINTTNTSITPTTIVKDTNSGWSGTGYTISVTGFYDVGGMLQNSGNLSGNTLLVQQNGSALITLGAGQYNGTTNFEISSGSTLLYCLSGDVITFYGTVGASSGAPSAFTAYVVRRSGPAVISATETVSAKMTAATTNTTGGAIGSPNRIGYDTVVWDDHGALTTGSSGTANFKCPVPGLYNVSASSGYAGAQGVSNTALSRLYIMKNGSIDHVMASEAWQSAGTSSKFFSPTTQIRCVTGDLLVPAISDQDSRAWGSDGTFNWVSFTRIGN